MLLCLPQMMPRWCADAIITRLSHSSKPQAPPLTLQFFEAVTQLIKAQKVDLMKVMEGLAVDQERLRDNVFTDALFDGVADAVTAELPKVNTLVTENFLLDISKVDAKLAKALGQSPLVLFALALIREGTWYSVRVLLECASVQLLVHRDVGLVLLARLHTALEPAVAALQPHGELGKSLDSSSVQDGWKLPVADLLSSDILQMLEVCTFMNVIIKTSVNLLACLQSFTYMPLLCFFSCFTFPSSNAYALFNAFNRFCS
jgi:hypothetical protein